MKARTTEAGMNGKPGFSTGAKVLLKLPQRITRLTERGRCLALEEP